MNRKLLSILIISLFINLVANANTEFPKVRGWKMADSARVFDSETLWEYINGAAESYFNYSFRQLEVMEYYRTSDEYIKVEVYHQSSDINAFGIYAQERQQEAEFLKLGCEGYMIHSSLNFYADEFYVKIHSHQTDDKTLETIQIIAEKLSGTLSDNPERPLILDLLPDYEKIPGSEKYYPSNYLGYSFLNNAIAADYSGGDLNYSMFILVCDSTEMALSVLSDYFKQTNTLEESVAERIFGIEDMFNGYVGLIVIDEFILGILDMSDKKLSHEYLEQFSEFVLQSNL